MNRWASQILRVRSGGQTGADRGALDAARACRVPILGWCPMGGWAEDLPFPPGVRTLYPELMPTPSLDPDDRTRRNVIDSDATLIVRLPGVRSPGSDLTLRVATLHRRPVLVCEGSDVAAVRGWLASLGGPVELNVAGPRESESPGSYSRTRALLTALLTTG
ncbi:MAG: putative molybdenum carrier protein [Propionicimonas sp.]|nr:putative molybdenum carrier protein [Propionicimonas sp.]